MPHKPIFMHKIAYVSAKYFIISILMHMHYPICTVSAFEGIPTLENIQHSTYVARTMWQLSSLARNATRHTHFTIAQSTHTHTQYIYMCVCVYTNLLFLLFKLPFCALFVCLCICCCMQTLLSLVCQVTNVCCRHSLPLICWRFCCHF